METNSTHCVEVVPVVLEPHPNADALSVVRVHGYQAIVRTDDWRGRSVGAYCPPDSVVPPGLVPGIEGRIRAIRLRGLWSEGLLVPAPDGVALGEDVARLLGVGHYVPPENPSVGDDAPAPPGLVPTYGLEAARRYATCLREGERVAITEKIHGANARYTFRDGEMHAGSRTGWKARTDDRSRVSQWWSALDAAPEVEAWCRANPGAVVFGEVYGQVQDLRYGIDRAARLVVFDIFADGRWLDHGEARDAAPDLPWVPTLYEGPWLGLDASAEHAEGESILARRNGTKHVREGCVVRPLSERWDPVAGRVVLKLIGRGYLARRER